MVYEPNEWGEWAGRENFVHKLRRLEEGLAAMSWGASPEDIAAAVTDYLSKYPPMGINPAELEGAIISYLTLNPPKGEIDPGEVAAAVLQYLEDNPIDPHPPGSHLVYVGDSAPDTTELSMWWDSHTGQLLRWDGQFLNEWVPVGEPSPVLAYHALALGRAQPGGVYSISIGDIGGSLPTGFYSIAIGSDAAAPGTNDLVLGYGAESSANGSGQIVLGRGATSHVANTVVIGYEAEAGDGSPGDSVNSIVIGYRARTADASNSVSLGYEAVARGSNVVVIGNLAETTNSAATNSVAVGTAAKVSELNSVAIGSNAEAHASNSVALGTSAAANGANGTALGVGAKANGANSAAVGLYASAEHDQSTAIGLSATTTADYQAMVSAAELVVKSPIYGEPVTSLVLFTADGTPVRIGVDQGQLTVDGSPVGGGGGGGGGPAQITTETLTAADGEGTVDLGAVGQVLDVTVSGPCRVRVYRTAAERTADAGRPFTTPYTAEAGLLYDQLFESAGVDKGRPWLYADELYWSVDGPADVTFRYVTTGVL